MKLFKRIIATIAALTAVIACIDEPEEVKVTGIEVNPATLTLNEKDTYTLTAEVSPATATDKTVKWSSSDMSVAAVQDGLVQAISAGTAVISATANDGSGASGHCVVTVVAGGVKVSGVSVSPDKLTVSIGGKATLTAEVKPSDATNKSVTWKSSDEGIAKVKDGEVEGIAAGEATITVTTVDGGYTADCKVTVTAEAIPAEYIFFDQSEYRVRPGEEIQLKVSTDPEGATVPELKWTSSDSKVASVSSDGLVSGKKIGETYITAKAKDNDELEAETRVIVIPDVSQVKDISFWQEDTWVFIDYKPEDYEYLLAVFTDPEGVDVDDLIVEIGDDESGMSPGKKPISLKREEYWCYVITPKTLGDCTVTVSTPDGKVSSTHRVHVRKYPKSFELAQSEITLGVGETVTVEGIFDPDPESVVPLYIMNEEMLDCITYYNENGLVLYGLDPGTVTFDVCPLDLVEFSRPLTVTVVDNSGPEVTDISLTEKAIYLHEGDDGFVTAIVDPWDANPYSLIWSVDDPEIVDLHVWSEDPFSYYVTARKVGKTKLHVRTAFDNGVEAECDIVVAEPSDVESVTLPETRTMKKSGVIYLTANIKGSYKTIEWINYDPELVRVTPDKKDPRSAKIDAWNQDGIATVAVLVDSYYVAYCEITVGSGASGDDHDYVDLGTGVKWATCNVGAYSPEGYGDYFAWGETSSKIEYTWANYMFGEQNALTRYCQKSNASYWDGVGDPDGKTDFKDYDYGDDAARVCWGGTWRTPTKDEWQKLIDNCSWSWIVDYNGTGVFGCLVTSMVKGYEDRSIFLPASGAVADGPFDLNNEGYYWASSIYSYPDQANFMHFTPGSESCNFDFRSYGFSIRPVKD